MQYGVDNCLDKQISLIPNKTQQWKPTKTGSCAVLCQTDEALESSTCFPSASDGNHHTLEENSHVCADISGINRFMQTDKQTKKRNNVYSGISGRADVFKTDLRINKYSFSTHIFAFSLCMLIILDKSNGVTFK